jgi:hypothetical protein
MVVPKGYAHSFSVYHLADGQSTLLYIMEELELLEQVYELVSQL